MIKKSFGAPLTPDTPTTLYEVPTGKRAEWVLMYITNPGSNTDKIEVDYYNAATDTTLIILQEYTINEKDFVTIGGDYHTFIVMQEGDKIIAEGDTNSSFTILVSVIEHNDIIQGG